MAAQMNLQSTSRAVALLCLIGFSAIGPVRANDIEVISGRAMGTSFTLKIANRSQDTSIEEISAEVSGELERLESIFSLYRPESELSRLNSADAGKWISVSRDLYTVLEFAVELSDQTSNAFDPTIYPLVKLWQGDSLNGSWSPPSADAVNTARKGVGIEHLQLRFDPPAVQKLSPQVQLDLNALVEGWAIEQVLKNLKARGCTDALLELGGEYGATGHRADGTNWKIGIEDPRNVSEIYATAGLNDGAICTSGTYRQNRVFAGKNYSHIVDPRTGSPVEHSLLSVSVLEANAMIADGWATALMVLGPEEGLKLADEYGLAASFVSRSPEPVSPLLSEKAMGKILFTGNLPKNANHASIEQQLNLRVISVGLLLVGIIALVRLALTKRIAG